MLRTVFFQLLSHYTTDNNQMESLWTEIHALHTHKSRHYHTLDHLDRLYTELLHLQGQIADWDCLLFSLFYHDSIYNVLKNNNEEKSALLAEKRLLALAVPITSIEKCKLQILSTKSHQVSQNNDTNFFTDADLSILGQDGEVYADYCQKIRKEYAIYPDLVYFPGRKKVLQHFLAMDQIYKTPAFYEQYEERARDNMQRELDAF
jgi:predicted metal-dependent HD superfamily phosphohydrolase